MDTPPRHAGGPARSHRLVRVVLPALLILGWLVAASVGGPYFGRVDEVSSNDATSYLPAGADATRVQQRLGDFIGDDTVPAVLVFVADEGRLTPAQLDRLRQVVGEVGELTGVGGGSGVLPSDDGRAAEAFLAVEADTDVEAVVSEVRSRLADALPTGVTAHVTGPAGFQADLSEAFAGIDGLLLGVALAAVLVILVIVYRSLLLPFAVLITSLFALCTALLTVWWLAKAGIVVLTGQTQGILFILVIGAATDYALLYTARYREELQRHADRGRATRRALRATWEPIIASAGTVIAGLLCLLLSDLNSNRSLGPVAAIGIAFALLSALTLLPALLFVLGRTGYWPRRPLYDPGQSRRSDDSRAVYGRLGVLIGRRARLLWIVVTVVLLAGTGAIGQLRAGGVAQSDLVIGTSDARDGQRALSRHFPGGSGAPAYVIVDRSELERATERIIDRPGVAQVAVTSTDAPGGAAPVTGDGIVAAGRPGGGSPEPTVVDGKVLLQVTVSAAPDSGAAEQTVRDLRRQLAGIGVVGGPTATAIDTNDASVRDRTLIIPVVLAVIMIILMALLRAVLAPVLLIITTVQSLGATLGVSALVFNELLDLPGADPAVPLYGFVFLVALGVDYNIFLMTRVREETGRHGTREGIRRGLAITGGVITSAGLVLAATFAALAVIPVLFLLQIAFIVAFGVLLDTFVVRTLLLPAVASDIGRAIWWPSRLDRRSKAAGSAR